MSDNFLETAVRQSSRDAAGILRDLALTPCEVPRRCTGPFPRCLSCRALEVFADSMERNGDTWTEPADVRAMLEISR